MSKPKVLFLLKSFKEVKHKSQKPQAKNKVSSDPPNDLKRTLTSEKDFVKIIKRVLGELYFASTTPRTSA